MSDSLQIPEMRAVPEGTDPTLMSNHDEWQTPDEPYLSWDSEFHFQLDPCCRPETSKCQYYFTKEHDGLVQDWYPYKSVFMNPPYGRAIKFWIKKAYEESRKDCTVVCLVPARVGSGWWRQYCTRGEVRILGRLKFRGYSKKHGCVIDNIGATFDSAVVIFRPPSFKKLNGRPIFRNPYPRGACPICEKRAYVEIPGYGWICINCNSTLRPGR